MPEAPAVRGRHPGRAYYNDFMATKKAKWVDDVPRHIRERRPESYENPAKRLWRVVLLVELLAVEGLVATCDPSRFHAEDLAVLRREVRRRGLGRGRVRDEHARRCTRDWAKLCAFARNPIWDTAVEMGDMEPARTESDSDFRDKGQLKGRYLGRSAKVFLDRLEHLAGRRPEWWRRCAFGLAVAYASDPERTDEPAPALLRHITRVHIVDGDLRGWTWAILLRYPKGKRGKGWVEREVVIPLVMREPWRRYLAWLKDGYKRAGVMRLHADLPLFPASKNTGARVADIPATHPVKRSATIGTWFRWLAGQDEVGLKVKPRDLRRTVSVDIHDIDAAGENALAGHTEAVFAKRYAEEERGKARIAARYQGVGSFEGPRIERVLPRAGSERKRISPGPLPPPDEAAESRRARCAEARME